MSYKVAVKSEFCYQYNCNSMARPIKASDQKRIYRLIVRLNASELKLIEDASKVSGMKPYAFARIKLLTGRFPKSLISAIDLKLYLELKKIGVNINQLTKLANMGKFHPVVKTALLRLVEQQDLIIKILLNDSEPKDR